MTKKKNTFASKTTYLLPALVIAISLFYCFANANADDGENTKEIELKSDLKKISNSLYHTLDSVNKVILAKQKYAQDLLNSEIEKRGGLHLGDSNVTWNVINPFSHEKIKLNLKPMMLGKEWLGQNTAIGLETTWLDKLSEKSGAQFQIFQRVDEEGNMLIVASTLQKYDGKKLTGNYIPAIRPDGSSNPYILELLNNDEFTRPTFVINKTYQTIYQPLLNNSGELIGNLYIGIPHEKDSKIRERIMELRIGESGFASVLQGKGYTKGTLIISHRGYNDGENMAHSNNPEKSKYASGILTIATNLTQDSISYYKHQWMSEDDTYPRDVVTSIQYFKPWDWVVCITAYLEDFDIK